MNLATGLQFAEDYGSQPSLVLLEFFSPLSFRHQNQHKRGTLEDKQGLQTQTLNYLSEPTLDLIPFLMFFVVGFSLHFPFRFQFPFCSDLQHLSHCWVSLSSLTLVFCEPAFQDNTVLPGPLSFQLSETSLLWSSFPDNPYPFPSSQMSTAMGQCQHVRRTLIVTISALSLMISSPLYNSLGGQQALAGKPPAQGAPRQPSLHHYQEYLFIGAGRAFQAAQS